MIIRYSCLLWLALAILWGCNSSKSTSESHQYTNNLIGESSPYLLQHAHNPVNWNPWKQTTLDTAKTENKLLLISIGYAACHWCHVMEHESFEDTAVARVMNEHFVNIKVDREERPDVDDVYMTACQLASQKGCGWPLNAIALPNGKPVWAGTYFPKKEWVKVLEYFIGIWETEPEKLQEYAARLTEGLQSMEDISVNIAPSEFSKDSLQLIARNFKANVDFIEGGKLGAPKFPLPNNWEFLMKYYHFTSDESALEAVNKTLTSMARGGIYDHLGGGFARYSTDPMWQIPHFEKMLYDNGQLVSLYSKAYQLTGNELYKNIVFETLDFIEREMTDKSGGFYSSYDADSEGEEGKFYVWSKNEIDSLLKDKKQSAIFNDFFEVKKDGNWEKTNILYRKKERERVAKKHDLSIEELEESISKSKKTLLKAREKREKPGLDDKILTAWNALMLKGYVDAYKAFGDKKYKDAALKNGNFLVDHMMQEDFRLNRNFKDGKSVINAFLDDYALTIDAFIGLYEITFDTQWLERADGLVRYAIEHFEEPETGMYFYTSDLDPPLVARKKVLTDNVISGSNSSFARALHALGTYLYKDDYLRKAEKMLHNMSPEFVGSAQPNFYANWAQLYLDFVRQPYEVAIVGPDFEEKRNELTQQYLPNVFLLGGSEEGSLELLKGKLQEGSTMIYVCQNKVCKLPVEEVEKALTLIK